MNTQIKVSFQFNADLATNSKCNLGNTYKNNITNLLRIPIQYTYSPTFHFGYIIHMCLYYMNTHAYIYIRI